jgi:molybdate transport system substrate-binding protein
MAIVMAAAALTVINANAERALVAVAANFARPAQQLVQQFQAQTGHTAVLTSGSTGKFYSQIVAGAPFQVLLSADTETPTRLVQEGHAVAASQFTYAFGELVLWSPQPGLVDAQGAVLATGRFKHLALANPKVAPYGRAAAEVLQARGLMAQLAPKLVMGQSIAQAHQFVSTGQAELGFVALSQVWVPDAAPAQARAHTPAHAPAQTPAQASLTLPGSYWRVPRDLYRPIQQDAVLLNAGKNNPAAIAFLAFLKTAPAQTLIQAGGYTLPTRWPTPLSTPQPTP